MLPDHATVAVQKESAHSISYSGRLYTGRGNSVQSADRCVMRQRTGASVFFERIREGA